VTLVRRPWEGWDDLAPIQALASARFRLDDRWLLHPGDIAWALGWFPKTDEELRAAVSLWHRGRELVAWSLLEGAELWTCATLDDDEAEDAVDEAAAAIPGPLTRIARADDGAAVARLRDGGYVHVPDNDMQVFVRSLDDVDVDAVDRRVRPVQPGDDLTGRLSVTHAAFGVSRPFDVYADAYAAFMRTPAYPVGWDLVASGADGEAAAVTIAWPDAGSGVGNFEPVAAHPAHRRRGFATAVMREGLRRLRAAGMRRAIVRTPATNTPALALYRSVGFVDAFVDQGFRRS
jgi:ribosomal protein S18 acetylase RimI-like enzyme